MKYKRYTLSALMLVIALAAIFFFANAGFSSWREIAGSSLQLNYYLLALSVGLGIASLLALSSGYYFLNRRMGIAIPFWKLVKARAFSDISSYVPGKIWALLTRMKYMKQWASRTEVIISSYLELAALILSALFAFIVLNMIYLGVFAEYALISYAALPVCIIFMHPKVVSFVINIGLKILKKEKISIPLSYRSIILANVIYSSYWLLTGLAIFFLTLSIYPVSGAYFPFIVLSYAVAWTLGFLSMIFPGGIGIREGVMVYALSIFLPLPVAMVVSVCSRGIIIISQLIFASVSWLAQI
ncbi:MAG: lysylphosphatidylglycerol synthase domain-containing protein [Nanoarchaeota archaeon]